MVHFNLPDKLIVDLRPIVENLWEKEQREQGKGEISATEVMLRVCMKFYELHKGKNIGTPKTYDMKDLRGR